jgi:hypothetical protein
MSFSAVEDLCAEDIQKRQWKMKSLIFLLALSTVCSVAATGRVVESLGGVQRFKQHANSLLVNGY